MNPSTIAITRLHNQQLINTSFKEPDELISHMGAIQGQDYSGAKWAVGLRLPGVHDSQVEKAFADKTIFRTWLMRGTLHFVTAKDIRWMLELLAPRIITSNMRRYWELELDEKTLKHGNNVLKEALEGGNELNRKELLAILQKRRISTEGQRGAYLLQRASLDGFICQCGVENNNPIYMSMDSVPKTRVKREEALAALTRCYFKSRGPATIRDFMWWSGLLAADAQAGIESVASEFIQERIGDAIYWHSGSKPEMPDMQVAHLLPTYDEYLFAYRDRSASVNLKKTINGLKNRYRPTIALNGQIIGTWKRTFKNRTIIMEYNPFKNLNNEENQALSQAELLYREFMNMNN
ncbi:MAG: winged helix DNA-binding domain-containing protein [Methanobacterium formicicum]